jgi:biopolymer transport protein ExbB
MQAGAPTTQQQQPSPPPGNFVQAPRLASNTNTANAAGAAANGNAATTEPRKDAIPARSLLQIFHDGGIMMYPIALCSFVLTVVTFERLIHLRVGRVIPRPFVKRLIEQLQQQQIDRDEAIELCDRNPSPMATIMMSAVKKYGKPAVEVEQAVLDAGERESNHLRRYMRLFSAVSNVAPLLGMLGTVTGMIQSFNDISSSQGMGRPEVLAGGIGEALLTTAAGLVVAIPAYLLYMYFLGRTDRLIMEMDSHAQRLVEVISAEGLQENDTSRSRVRTRKAA